MSRTAIAASAIFLCMSQEESLCILVFESFIISSENRVIMGKKECELTHLCRIAQKRKEAICREYPGILATERIETDTALDREYVVITMTKDRDVKGFEFIETNSTFLTETKGQRYADILKKGQYLGIVVPGHTRDRALMLRSRFREEDLMNPAFFVYDEYGDVRSL